MMRYLTSAELMTLYQQVMEQSGGYAALQNPAAVESALAQPRQTFDGVDLYPTVIEKAAVLGFALIRNHPFVDGNKRIGHAAMEVFLLLHGLEIGAPSDQQEQIMLAVAAGQLDLAHLTAWLRSECQPYAPADTDAAPP